jgi:hypothetical protein
MRPFGRCFEASHRVALYLFQDGSRVIENVNDEPAGVMLDGLPQRSAPRGWVYEWK